MRLRGVNLDDDAAIDTAQAADLLRLGFNFVRMRMTFKPDTISKGRFLPATIDHTRLSGLTLDYENAIDDWIRILSAHHIWILMEMRADDVLTSDEPAFYDTTQTGPLPDGGATYFNTARPGRTSPTNTRTRTTSRASGCWRNPASARPCRATRARTSPMT